MVAEDGPLSSWSQAPRPSGCSIRCSFEMSSCRCSRHLAPAERDMNTTTLTSLLQIAGILHLGLLAAGLTMPRVVDLEKHLKPLPKFIRQLFWVYYSFIGLCLLSFGSVTILLAGPLAQGSVLARSVCGFLAVFWTVRLVVATFIFDVGPYLTNFYRRLGHQLTTVAFVYLPV